MRLYLIQHGEAESKDVDPERHLTQKGKRDAEKVAAFLEHLALSLGAVWHSGKARARETAEIMSRPVKLEQGVVEREGLGPMDPVGPVGEAVRSGGRDVMLVGHMPFVSKLASALITGDENAELIAFQNAGVVCLASDDEGTWRVQWIVTPGLLA